MSKINDAYEIDYLKELFYNTNYELVLFPSYEDVINNSKYMNANIALAPLTLHDNWNNFEQISDIVDKLNVLILILLSDEYGQRMNYFNLTIE